MNDKSAAAPKLTSAQVVSGYAARSWRFLVERQQFVMGKREGSYFWDLDGTRRILDCQNTGGVHSLGHRNPEIVQTVIDALGTLDSGSWTMATPEHLALRDALVASAPTQQLTRTVVTLCATETIDLALMFAARVTGRRKLVAYRNGYHGHGGLAAVITGSKSEGTLEHYSLPVGDSRFFPQFDDLESASRLIDQTCAAVILEPLNYETFQPASEQFLNGLSKLCRDRGVLLIIDETRTALGRSGKLYMSSHYNMDPDIVILGKGLGGGVYPVSAMLVTQKVYDECMNQNSGWGYQSSYAGSPIGALVASKVLEIVQRPETVANVVSLQNALRNQFAQLCERYPDVFAPAWVQGGIAVIRLVDTAAAPRARAALFERGVMCHSVSEIEPRVIKFFPCLTSGPSVPGEIANALDGFAQQLRAERRTGA